MDINKLAILSNQLGGIGETADFLGVDDTLILRAIQGESLSNIENAILENGFNQIYLEPELASEIDLDVLEDYKPYLDRTEIFIDDSNLYYNFRESLADSEINLDYISQGYGIFADLTTAQMARVIENIDEVETDYNTMFEKYFADGKMILRGQIEESEFWEWYREYFYDD